MSFSYYPLLLINFSATAIMTGVIWFVQLVQYPGFRNVSKQSFGAFHAAHTQHTGWVVILPMFIEIGVSAAMLLMSGPQPTLRIVSFGLALLTWVLTFWLFVPMHGQLAQGFNVEIADRLVRLNWWRTAAWTAHFACLFYMLLTISKNDL